MYVTLQATLLTNGTVNFLWWYSKGANKRVLFDKSVGNMTARGEL
jgi:hypothetical protein